MKKTNKFIVFAYFYMILFIIFTIVRCIIFFKNVSTIGICIFVSSTIADIIIFCLFLGLGHCVSRVENLEDKLIDKKIIKNNDLDFRLEKAIQDEIVKDGNLCPHCGYQVFPEDEKCGFCGKELKKQVAQKKK